MRTTAFLPRLLHLLQLAAVDLRQAACSKRTIIHIITKYFSVLVCLFIVVFGEQGCTLFSLECIQCLFIFNCTLFIASSSADNTKWKWCSVVNFDSFLRVAWSLALSDFILRVPARENSCHAEKCWQFNEIKSILRFQCCLFVRVCNCEIVYLAQDIHRGFLWLIPHDYVCSLHLY